MQGVALIGSVEARNGRFVATGDIIMTAGWRHLDMDYHDNGAAMDGPILGAVYRS